MSEKRFEIVKGIDCNVNKEAYFIQDTHYGVLKFGSFWKEKFAKEDCKRLNDICELIEELHTSDHMGWERAEMFEKKCPKELHNKEMYIKRLEYKVQKFKEENELLRLELETHKHPLWSTREAEKKVNKLADSLADEIKKNGLLNEEINQLRIENMRLKKKGGDGV